MSDLASFSSPSPSSASGPDVSLIRICLLWAAFHGARQPPSGCREVLSEDFMTELRDSGQLAMIVRSLNENHNAWSQLEQSELNRHHVRYRYHYTHKSLSVIGVLGGIVLILMLVALSTCIRNRRNILLEQQAEGHERFARQILIDHLRHVGNASASDSTAVRPNDTPPKYDDVVKVDDHDHDQCPPSYVEAVQLEQDQEQLQPQQQQPQQQQQQEVQREGRDVDDQRVHGQVGVDHAVRLEVAASLDNAQAITGTNRRVGGNTTSEEALV